MKRKFRNSALVLSLAGILGSRVLPASAAELDRESGSEVALYRLYNPNSGEHFYTASQNERDHLKSVGWKSEGIGWYAPEDSQNPVYRLYNANAGDHHYTLNENEKSFLEAQGWKYEGISWYSDDDNRVPLYRQYNPNAKAGSHNYTTNEKEHNFLVQNGWKGEGIAWYAIKAGKPEEQSIDYMSLYRPYVNHALNVVRTGNGSGNDDAGLVELYSNGQSVYFALEDMNGNHIPELAIFNAQGGIMQLYTIRDGRAVCEISSYMRSMNNYMGNGLFSYFGYGGMYSNAAGVYALDSTGHQQWREFYIYDAKFDGTSSTYFNRSGSWDVNNSLRLGDGSLFREKTDSFINTPSALSLTPLENF